jgi:hypothetical protein
MYGINILPYNIVPNKYYSRYIRDNLNNTQHHHQSVARRTTVSLDTQIYLRLKDYGKFGETFSNVIARILDELEGGKTKN